MTLIQSIQKSVVAGDTPATRLLLLHPEIKSLEDLPAHLRESAVAHEASLVDHTLSVGYDYWTADQIIRSVLPPEITEVTTAYEQIGHIAHMNLRDAHLPYKHFIGEVGSRE